MKNNDSIPGFNPDAGAPIPLAEAADWTANYRNEALTEAEVAGRKRINAYYFGNKLLDEIQNQEGCVGLRFYMGVSNLKDVRGKEESIEKDKRQSRYDESQIIVAGVDKYGRDIVPRLGVDGQAMHEDGIVGDGAGRCPLMCDTTSPLS